MDRRALLGGAAAAAALAACGDRAGLEAFLAKQFRELSPEELQALLARVKAECERRFGRSVTVEATPAPARTEFAMGLDLSRCVGCRRCAYACAKENNPSRDPQIHWITVLRMRQEKGVDFAHADATYDPAQVPEPGHFYLPVACQHCRDAPCVRVCPVGATWIEPDGIVAIDPDWCIGCRCCMAACPYGARRFNWTAPSLPAAELNPEMHLLGNRPRSKGVVEKCTFCIHRVRKGRYPACVEICPAGARKFGNLLDASSEVRRAMDTKRVFVLREELGTDPRFFYFYS
jgi:molybdopterin-containing oxidoreductase family iron-sulfur binding subunit